ncbi:glycosyltransferase family 2 protein [Leptolyngbya sp. PCC 6406]|uniref:glycosyltransferase family 2 protein n=1 Tax=Leptolyngbya sp. PCC 6406 TaxID=1173264 RepID=UPI0002ABB120|nr:glycosyltransferase family 2 protein [Leptolyngbya sp. PCC 6406]
MNRSWSVEIRKVLLTHSLLIFIPTALLLALQSNGYSIQGLHRTISTLYLISAFVLILESTVALFRRFSSHPKRFSKGFIDQQWDAFKVGLGVGGARIPAPLLPLPRCSFLVVAYLPNEQDIILETLIHILEHIHRPKAGLEVILAYNTPMDLPVESALQALARQHPELQLLRVKDSRSKAENLNAALEIVTGEVTCVLDADHHPPADCFLRAWHWLGQNYDVVQGRNVVRNYDHNWLTETIAIEFESIYGISHSAVSFLTDTSIFAGSNGYWRTTVLQQVCFDARMLTEDIDATLRTLSRGYRILHDRSIVTSELAPTDLLSFWYQRKRWAQGWIEVSFKYQRFIWGFPKFTVLQKLYWTCLLYGCQFYPIMAVQVFPVLLSVLLFQGSWAGTHDPYLWFVTCLGLSAIAYKSWVTARVAALQYPLLSHIKHALMLIPLITLKNAIAIVGLYDYLRGNNTWWITPRSPALGSRRRLARPVPVSTAKL